MFHSYSNIAHCIPIERTESMSFATRYNTINVIETISFCSGREAGLATIKISDLPINRWMHIIKAEILTTKFGEAVRLVIRLHDSETYSWLPKKYAKAVLDVEELRGASFLIASRSEKAGQELHFRSALQTTAAAYTTPPRISSPEDLSRFETPRTYHVKPRRSHQFRYHNEEEETKLSSIATIPEEVDEEEGEEEDCSQPYDRSLHLFAH